MWLSPRRLLEFKAVLNIAAETTSDMAELTKLMRENAQLNRALENLPDEATAPETLNAMFAIRDMADEWQKAHWENMAQRDVRIDRNNWAANSRYVRSVPDRAEIQMLSMISDAKKQEEALKKDGKTSEQIAAAMSRTYGSVVSAAEVSSGQVWWRVDDDSNRRVWTEKTIADVKAMSEAGMSRADIAAHMSEKLSRPMSKTAIDHVFKEGMGPERGDWTDAHVKAVADLLDAGADRERIAAVMSDKMGVEVSKHAINQIVSRKQLSRPAGWPTEVIDALKGDELSSMTSLDAARALYERYGFKIDRSRISRWRQKQSDPMFALRDESPEPSLKSDLAFVDRLGTMKDLIEACR